MTQYSGDIRTHIRTAIGYDWEIDGVEVSTVSVVDSIKDTVYVPIYLEEYMLAYQPRLPFIYLKNISTTEQTQNIGGDTKYKEGIIDCNIAYTHQDNISAGTFGITVADKICQLVHTYRASTTSAYHIEVNGTTDYYEFSTNGKISAFHKVVSLYCQNYQK